MQRHNWRRAAAYMYRYSLRIREESRSPNLQEELHGILAAINALQLVDPSNAWFELPSRACEWPAPLKRPRLTAGISGLWVSISDLCCIGCW
jgi:nuclear pore complex protein Nup160